MRDARLARVVLPSSLRPEATRRSQERAERLSGPTRVTRIQGEAKDGLLDVSVTLDGEGPFSFNLQLVSHPERTATVPLPAPIFYTLFLISCSTFGFTMLYKLSASCFKIFCMSGSLKFK